MVMIGLAFAALLPIPQQAWENVNRRLENADPVVALERFVNYPSEAMKDRFTHNPKFWAKGIDFSCASPWNSAGGSQRAGTLISKRHIIFAQHFPLWKGVRIVFVGEDGGVCPCYVEKTKPLKRGDIMIGLLNAEVTPNIHPAKILPVGFEKYIGDGKGMPVGTFNQKEKLYLTEANAVPTNGAPMYGISSRDTTSAKLARFREDIVGGDSGNPAFLLIGDQAILAYCLYSVAAGPAPHMYRSEIQQTMDELCPGYKLEEFDFKALKGKLK